MFRSKVILWKLVSIQYPSLLGFQAWIQCEFDVRIHSFTDIIFESSVFDPTRYESKHQICTEFMLEMHSTYNPRSDGMTGILFTSGHRTPQSGFNHRLTYRMEHLTRNIQTTVFFQKTPVLALFLKNWQTLIWLNCDLLELKHQLYHFQKQKIDSSISQFNCI